MIRARFWRAMLRKYLPSYVMIVSTDDVSEMCTSDRFVWNARQAAVGRGCVKTWVNFELGGRATPPHHERIAYSAI